MAEAPMPAFIAALVYKDNRAALAWLEKAFGFEISELLTDSKDDIVFAEMSRGDGFVRISSEFADWTKSPSSIGGFNTQRMFVYLDSGIDAHCEHARNAGAKIFMEPNETFYGHRTYVAIDPEGHYWTFFQVTKHATAADYEKAGFKSKKLGR